MPAAKKRAARRRIILTAEFSAHPQAKLRDIRAAVREALRDAVWDVYTAEQYVRDSATAIGAVSCARKEGGP